MPTDDLSHSEFTRLLRHGRGRAALFVQQHGLAGVAAIVLDACLEETAYDRQCEPGRARWLLDMIAGTEEYPAMSAAILTALVRATEHRDIEHLCEMAAEMGKNGDDAAAAALRKYVLGQTISPDAARYGDRALADLDGIDASTPHLNTTAALTEEARQARVRERTRREFPLQKILDDATAGAGTFAARYYRFGKFATASELDTVFQKLLNETDDDIRLRLLWVFRHTPMPELHPHIFGLAESENDAIRAAALNALAQHAAPAIGALGRAALSGEKLARRDYDILGLFVKNFQDNDAALILASLSNIPPDDDEAHALGSDLLAIFKENPSPARSALLRWVYEENPCGICRRQALEGLIGIDAASPDIISESLHDANEDIRKVASGFLQR